MATPMAGEGPIAAAIPRSRPPPDAGGAVAGGSAAEAPVLIFVYFHKAIRAELERMHAAAVRLATTAGGVEGEGVAALEARCRFLFAVYRHHCHAEDAVRTARRFSCLSRCIFSCFVHRAALVLRSWRLPATTEAAGVRACGIMVIRTGVETRGCEIVTMTKVLRIWLGMTLNCGYIGMIWKWVEFTSTASWLCDLIILKWVLWGACTCAARVTVNN
jgi:hypothetical protein